MISMLSRDRMQAVRNSAMSAPSVPNSSSWSIDSAERRKRRIERIGPSIAAGGMIAFTREPSGSRASTMGEVSSTRRPTRETIRLMMRSRWSLSANRIAVASSLPWRSM